MATKTAWIEIAISASKALNAINRLDRSFKKLGDVVSVAMTAITLVQTGKVIGEIEKLGVEVNNVTNRFNQLGRPGLLDKLRVATKGLVADLDLMKQAIKFENFALPMEKMATMLEFANMRAAQTGESVDYMVDSIVRGLGRESILVLDNLQINVAKFSELVKSGTSYVDALSQMMAGELANSSEIAASGFTQFSVSITNVSNSLAKFINEAPILSKLWKELAYWINKAAEILDKASKSQEDFAAERASMYLSSVRAMLAEDKLTEANLAFADAVTQADAAAKKSYDTMLRIAEMEGEMSDEAALANKEWEIQVKVVDQLRLAYARLLKEWQKAKPALEPGRAKDSVPKSLKNRGLPNLGLYSNPSLQLQATIGANDQFMAITEAFDTEMMKRINDGLNLTMSFIDGIGDGLAQAIIYGQSFGQAMVSALKAITAQLIAAVTQALILAALITAFPAVGAALGVSGTFGEVFKTVLRGSDLYMSGERQGSRYSRTGGSL